MEWLKGLQKKRWEKAKIEQMAKCWCAGAQGLDVRARWPDVRGAGCPGCRARCPDVRSVDELEEHVDKRKFWGKIRTILWMESGEKMGES